MKRILALVALLFSTQAFAADTIGKQAVRTNANTDVKVQVAGADGSTLGQISANNTAQSTGGAWVLPAIVQSALPTYSTNGNMVGLTVDATGQLYVKLNSNASVNVAQINGATASATNAMPSQLTDGTAVYVGAKTGQLPTALGQGTMAASMSVAIASNQSTLTVTQGAPSGVFTTRAAPVNIAAAGTTALVLKSGLAVSQPLKMYSVTLSSAALMRCTVRYNDNGSFTNWGDVVLSPAEPTVTLPCPAGFCAMTTSATSTTQQFEANCTNFDSAAQDVGGNVSGCQAASGC